MKDKPKVRLKNMKNKITKYTDDIWYPDKKLNERQINTNSWFNISEYASNTKNKFKQRRYILEKSEKIKYHSIKITLVLNEQQKNIIKSWLNLYLDMYNIALKYVKGHIETDKKVLNWKYLRGLLKQEKNDLIKKSDIKVHDIDYAIKLVCQNYKSAITNYKNGHINYFRIRYWRKKKRNKIMDMEKYNFSKNGIRYKTLGKIMGLYNGKKYNFEEIDCDCKLQHVDDKYYLFVPIKGQNNTQLKKDHNKMISIDPGIRTFGTGITENKIIKIGENCGNKIRNYLKRKDGINGNDQISEEIKKKNEEMINKKIKNAVNDMHWKSINYLIKNNEIILIGNMSSKNIVRKIGKLDKMTKRIAMSLAFYIFRQRLKYKCDINEIKYGEIDEWMTSKMCSKCGYVKWDLGGNKIYKCDHCKRNIDRDVNGARNIYIKSIK